MSEPFLGELRMMSFSFPPKGWALCNGQLLPINQNQPLFSLLGTTYGGNGQTTFALPDLRGRTPIHMSQGFTLGEVGGEQAHTLSIAEIPTHVHTLNASSASATAVVPTNGLVLAQGAFEIYRGASNLTAMTGGTVGNTGGSQAHLNMQPFLVLSFCIALQGIFPSQN
jgi:microcystin-dependent protein